jgi:mannan endo-1,4-beta-mannosidase
MTRSRAQLSVRYVSMARPLAPSFLHSAMRTAAGATPVIEITPTAPGQPPVSLADIIAGNRDGWLKAFRNQVQALHRPVVVSFAPEPNGRWYSWGQDPAGFTAAYRHAHAIIGGTDHWVTWLWQVSARNPGDPATSDVRAYWPGGDVVNWAGLDGYYYLPADTFESRFGYTIREVQGWWGGPILIAETGASPATGHQAKDITDLFNGVYKYGLLGLIYFDLPPACPPQCGPFHPDVRLDNAPDALKAYIAAVSGAW